MTDAVGDAKRALRRELRSRRRAMTEKELAESTEKLTERLTSLALELGVTSMSAYLSAADEPNTRPFLNWANERGIRVLFPITRADGLLDWALSSDFETETEGLFGIPEPVGPVLSPMAINDVDLIVIPAAQIDSTGMRMGWGKGYFDKTLGSMARRPPVYAVVFDAEFVQTVPSERHDQPVDGVVTPSAIHRF
ncbi:5-formyltetrahydrofolate cyclo-ligase [Frondihabitans cladoniiphilus]|uniref:5-formyltetrahydrofolate cyclo-ligase n=1 Tax=Frondihabitans cladoniiphilus TaxID=715785 RepID=A0ABP8VW02_9MICO